MASDSSVPRPSILARAIGFFLGTVGLVIKLGLLAILNALAVWAIGILIAVYLTEFAAAGISGSAADTHAPSKSPSRSPCARIAVTTPPS